MDTSNKPNQPLQNKSNTSDTKSRNDNVYKGTILVLVIIIGVLTFMLITGRQALQEVSTEKTIVNELNLELKDELNNVLNEYTMVKHEYDSVLTKQDSIIQANAREIEKLIAEQGDYRRIRRQLNLLREITQNYVREIDSLYTENRVLKAENVEMQQEIQRVTRQTTQLTETKQELEGKVEVASALRAFQINATPMRLRGRDREDETDRARRTDRIKVCFTVAANPVASPGNKNAYVRIADPSGSILRLGDDERYSFTIGKDTLQFSMRGQFNYINQDTDVCLYWDKQEEFDEGMYLVSLFTDEFRLGETQFSLR
ncbi:MAG: hypothetical protein EA361_10760 [Bacteroidetes bacterium]|nr:MAG: hypothetical protein EA361_10760 [Bacteroidota bacterium]